jgi:hypothetical protein
LGHAGSGQCAATPRHTITVHMTDGSACCAVAGGQELSEEPACLLPLHVSCCRDQMQAPSRDEQVARPPAMQQQQPEGQPVSAAAGSSPQPAAPAPAPSTAAAEGVTAGVAAARPDADAAPAVVAAAAPPPPAVSAVVDTHVAVGAQAATAPAAAGAHGGQAGAARELQKWVQCAACNRWRKVRAGLAGTPMACHAASTCCRSS